MEHRLHRMVDDKETKSDQRLENTDAEMGSKLDKLEAKLEKLEEYLKQHSEAGFNRLRLEIKNDRLADQLKSKVEEVKVG